jgi:hypothetical protein
VGVLGIFPNMNYKPWFALGELVDNAIASYQREQRRLLEIEGEDFQLEVEVEIDAAVDRIRVADNAAGISAERYADAFVTADPPPDTNGLAQFGMGMKSASCWFARKWSVRTKALGENVERTVSFDIPEIVRTHREVLEPTTLRVARTGHYTEILLDDLYRPPKGATLAKMRDHLASIYRIFLQSGDVELIFNGEPLSYQQPRVLVAPIWRSPTGQPREWRKDVEFTLTTGETVTGKAALLQKGSVKYAGLALFRRGRLVVGSGDETYRPPEIFGGPNSYKYQRVVGELHLEDFDVSYTKDGFIWGEREGEFLRALKRALDGGSLPLLQQAENYRARASQAEVVKATSKAVTSTGAVLGGMAEALGRHVTSPPTEDVKARRSRSDHVASEFTVTLVVADQEWQIVIDVANDPAKHDWLTVTDSGPASKKGEIRRIGISVNAATPFMSRFAGARGDEVEPLLRLAVGLGLAEATARDSGVAMAGIVRKRLNDYLRGPLATTLGGGA